MKLQFKPLNVPILILSDDPGSLTGLGRVGRDIASLLCTLPQFRVGYLGRGSVGRRKFPFAQYSYPESGQWGEDYIAKVWNDFSGGDNGIIWSNWDASRLLWFSQPHTLQSANPELAKFLGEGRNFLKFGYFPIDGTGPNGYSLPVSMEAAVDGFDRVLATSEWGMNTLKEGTADWLPHGIWMDKFKPFMPRGLEMAIQRTDRDYLSWKFDGVYLGCNMSNQSRKDWPAAFECAAALKHDYGNRFHAWFHTDTPLRYWNFYALAADYGVDDCTEVTLDLTDEQLALRYSACDCTILPSGGEGFGYPIAESMACGTACVVTDYAAGQELVGDDCKVQPVAFRVDTQHNVRRAVNSGYAFAQKAKGQIEAKRKDWEGRGEELRAKVEHLSWLKLKTIWERWFLDGLK